MILNIVFLILGLVLILVGANALTDGASSLAKRWGMSDLVVGLTIVAFGTSAPELVISVMSAVDGNAGLAIGNVVGSNIFNVCAIIGITSLVRPMRISKSILTTDIPLVILSALVLLTMGNASLLDGSKTNMLTRVDGIILLLFFMVFMHHTFSSARHAASGDPAAKGGESKRKMPVWKAWLWACGTDLRRRQVCGRRFRNSRGIGRERCRDRSYDCGGGHIFAGTCHLDNGCPERQDRYSPGKCNREQHLQYIPCVGMCGNGKTVAIRSRR